MWFLRTNATWSTILPRLILALTFIPAGWSKLIDFQSKALSWQVNFGFEYWQTGVAVFVEFFGGIAIALGLLTRLSAFGIVPIAGGRGAIREVNGRLIARGMCPLS